MIAAAESGTYDTSNAAIWWCTERSVDVPDFHSKVLAWMQSLGFNPNRLGPRCGVCRRGGKYELHVDEYIADENGPNWLRTDPLDHEAVLKVRRIVMVEKGSWPEMPDEANTWT